MKVSEILLLILVSLIVPPYFPSANPTEIDYVLPSKSSKHWTIQADSAPTASYGNIEINDTSCEIYFLNETGFEEWSQKGFTNAYLRLSSFENNLTFWEPIHSSGNYYIGIVNHGDNAVQISGIWLFDIWGPTINVNIADGETIEGTTSVEVTAQDEWSEVDSLTLFIDSDEVESADTNNLTFDWYTRQYSNGMHSIRIEALDAAGNIAEHEIEIEVRNAETGNGEDEHLLGPPNWFYWLIGLGMIIGLWSGIKWWIEERKSNGRN